MKFEMERWGLISAGEETAGDDDRALPSVAGKESNSFSVK